jgi:hypothetical protein
MSKTTVIIDQLNKKCFTKWRVFEIIDVKIC